MGRSPGGHSSGALARVRTHFLFILSNHMDFGGWGSIFASSTTDMAAMATFLRPLVIFVIIPLLMLGALFMLVRVLMMLIHGKGS